MPKVPLTCKREAEQHLGDEKRKIVSVKIPGAISLCMVSQLQNKSTGKYICYRASVKNFRLARQKAANQKC